MIVGNSTAGVAAEDGVQSLQWAQWLGWALFASIAANTIYFALKAANPLVISDAWYYLGAFVEKASRGSLGISDFFVKRTSLDHSLPLHKLLLLANYRFFRLDFSFDAFVGIGFALGALLVIRRTLRQSVASQFNTVAAQVGFVAICAIYLSLNATAIYEWPLLTMGFCTQFFFALLYVASWQTCVRQRYGVLVLLAGLSLVIADGGGIIAVLAAIGALGLLAIRAGHRRPALISIALLVASILVYKIAYQLLAPPYAVAPVGPGIAALLTSPHLAGRVITWIQLALSSSILHPTQTQAMFGDAGPRVDMLIALLLAVAHVAFWWQAFKRRPTIASHFAVALMLLFYGLWAGVLIARVPGYGDGAFTQPRYVIFFQLNIVALLMMAVDRLGASQGLRDAKSASIGLMLASLVVIAVQVPVTRNAWKRQPFESHYVQQLALQMDQLAADPAVVPKNCLPLLTVCRMPEDQRLQLMALLQNEHLNLFSPSFRARHDLQSAP
jgi:hypothetical protein